MTTKRSSGFGRGSRRSQSRAVDKHAVWATLFKGVMRHARMTREGSEARDRENVNTRSWLPTL